MKKVGDVQASLCCPRMLIVSFAAALFGSADVRAEQPATTQTGHWSAEKILPPEPGRKACWHRVYDAKHLAAHPQQKVTELTFFLRVSGYDAGGVTIDKLLSGDGLSISLEGDGIAFGGDCYTTRGTWVRPGSDDKVFHLDPVSVEACKTLEKEQLGGWDNEPRR